MSTKTKPGSGPIIDPGPGEVQAAAEFVSELAGDDLSAFNVAVNLFGTTMWAAHQKYTTFEAAEAILANFKQTLLEYGITGPKLWSLHNDWCDGDLWVTGICILECPSILEVVAKGLRPEDEYD
jgi:hypothetical protein